MKKEDIHFGDWARMFIGEVPPGFYVEIIIRTLFVYILLTVAMRLMGKRMSSQLNRNELAAMVTLAAAIGVPIQSPDRGLIPALIIGIIVIIGQRMIARRSFKSEKFEQVTQGDISVLVEDGELRLEEMQKARISREFLFAQLRANQIAHLGEVKRVYMESNGEFSILKNEKPEPGLSVIPEWDEDFRKEQKSAPEQYVCSNCGNKKAAQHDELCSNCQNTVWMEAVAVA